MRILIVDDDPVIRLLTSDCVSALGHEPIAVSSGEECLSFLSSAPAHPDVVLLDMMMPTMSGLDVLHTLRQSPQLKSLRVIMLSAESDAKEILQKNNLHADGILGKPFLMKELAESLNPLA